MSIETQKKNRKKSNKNEQIELRGIEEKRCNNIISCVTIFCSKQPFALKSPQQLKRINFEDIKFLLHLGPLEKTFLILESSGKFVSEKGNYSQTRKTVNTRNTSGMLLSCKRKASQV